VTAANVADVTMLQAVVDDIPSVRTPSGRRRTRPGKLDADKGYDSKANRAYLRRRGIIARIARRGIESASRLGRHRWRVERALSWLSCYRRLAIRWDRDSERFLAFVLLACAHLFQPALTDHREPGANRHRRVDERRTPARGRVGRLMWQAIAATPPWWLLQPP
jgi:hypothetical protein